MRVRPTSRIGINYSYHRHPMSDHHQRRNLEFLVRLYRTMKLGLPPQLLDELAQAGIDPADVGDDDRRQGSESDTIPPPS